jgi:F-type H+-transporting ATPase subunit b
VIEKRRAFSERAFAEAAEAKDKAAAAEARLEADRTALAEERRALIAKVHEEMSAERDKILAGARQDADRMVADAGKAVAEERRRTEAAMRDQLAALAVDLAGTLLRETGAGSIDEAALDRVCRQVEGLAETERTRMAADLARAGSAGGDAAITVATATPLDAKVQAKWHKRIADLFPAGDAAEGETSIRFEVDPALVGGAELRLPHTVVKFTWADLLAKAETELSRDQAAE